MRHVRLALAVTGALALAPAAASAYTIVDYQTGKGPVSEAYIAAAPNGLWWPSASQFGHLAPGSAVPGTTDGVTFVDNALGAAAGMTLGPDGDIYFLGSNGSGKGVDKLDPSTGATHTVSADATTGLPGYKLAFAPNANLVESTLNLNGALYGAPGYSNPSQSAGWSHGVALDVATDAAGNAWFPLDDSSDGLIAKMAAGTVGLTYYTTPTATAQPWRITVDDQGDVWFTEKGKNAVAELAPALTTANGSSGITEYSVPSSIGGFPNHIVTAPDGTIWFTESDNLQNTGADNQIGRIVPPATPGGAATFTMTPTPNGEIPSGLTVDDGGNVWYLAGSNIGEIKDAAPATPSGPGGTPPGSTPPGPGTTTTVTGVGGVRTEKPKVTGTTVSQNLACVGPPAQPCSIVFNIDTQEIYDNEGFPVNLKAGHNAFADRKKRKKPKNVLVGTKKITLHGGESVTVKIKLNGTGNKLLKKFKKLPATLSVNEATGGGKSKLVGHSKVTFKAPKKKH